MEPNTTEKKVFVKFKLYFKMIEAFDEPAKTLSFFEDNKNYFKAHNFDRRSHKFSLRENDKTASVLSKKQLKTVDFGGTQRQKSVMDLIMDIENEPLIEEFGGVNAREEKGFMHYDDPMAQNRAIKILANLLGFDESMDLSNYVYVAPKVEEKPEAEPYKKGYIKRMQRAMKSSKSKAIFLDLLDGLCRSCSKEEKNNAVKIFDIGLNDYVVTNKKTNLPETVYRLFIPEYDDKFQAFGSFRYNRTLAPKGLRRRDARKLLFGSHLISKFDETKAIIFSEGHSDTVVNNAKGLQTITSGAATNKIGNNIELMKGKTFHFYPDLDDAGFKGVTNKIIEIEEFNAKTSIENKISYQVFLWSNKVLIEDKETKLDKETLVSELTRDQDDWVLRYTEREETSLSVEELLSFVDWEKWKLLSKTAKKKGYDFIDFHEEHHEHANYSKFVEKYTY